MGYKLYPRRFAILASFAANNALNACEWIAFASVASIAQQRFNVSAGAINMLSLVFMILYVPVSVAAAYSMERFGLRATLVAGAFLNAGCAWIRWGGCLVDDPESAFAIVMLGQVLGALSQPVWTNAPTRLSGDWFGSEERDIATTVAAMSNPIGNAIGAVVPGIIVLVPHDITMWMLYQAVVATVVLLGTLVSVRDEPPTPPSSSAEERAAARSALETEAAQRRELMTLAPTAEDVHGQLLHVAHSSSASEALHRLRIDTAEMLKNRNFMFLALGFGVGLGLFNALITLIEQIVTPCGYSSELAALSGGALLLCGLIGAAIMSVFMEKTKQYALLQKVCVVFACGAMLFMLGSLAPDHDAQVAASFGLLGFFLIPLLPVNLESAAEVTYPVPEDNSAAVVLSAGQLLGIVYTFVLPVLLNVGKSRDCSSVFTSFGAFVLLNMIIAVVCMMVFQPDYRRKAAERKHVEASLMSHETADVPFLNSGDAPLRKDEQA